MTKTELYKKLCFYDPRSPDFDPEYPEAKNPCYCDNCFHGITPLALEMLKMQSKVNALDECVRLLGTKDGERFYKSYAFINLKFVIARFKA